MVTTTQEMVRLGVLVAAVDVMKMEPTPLAVLALPVKAMLAVLVVIDKVLESLGIHLAVVVVLPL